MPHDWAITGPFSPENDPWKPGYTGGLPWVGKGWYRTTFTVPEGKKATLLFDGAMSHATVYVNGKELYSWPNGYSAVPVDVSEAVKPGDNTLEVSLENLPDASRWYPGAGLYRNVHLILTDPVHIPVWGTRITTPEVSATQATVRIETAVEGAKGHEVVVRHVISSGDEVVVEKSGDFSTSVEMTTGTVEMTIPAPALWSPEAPNLYKAITTVYADGVKTDEYETVFGIRKAEFIDGKGFYLNGVPTKFKGVCLHHDQGPLGTAVSVSALRHQLQMLKDMGCNAIRTSHNQPAPELVRLCDEMGFMMMLEAFDEWKSAKCENGYHKDFDAWAEKDLTGLIRAFRNNPSVILWSTGNEVCQVKDDPNEGLKEAQFLTEICHREDPTRPVTVGMHMWHRFLRKEWRDAFDVIGVNYHPWKFLELKEAIGPRSVLGVESGSTISSRGVYHLPAVKTRDMVLSPDQQCSSYDLESCRWSNTPDCDIAIYEDYPWALGQFVWTGFDYLGEPTPYEDDHWPNHSSMFGIVDLASIPKDRYYLFRSVWNTAEHTLHILPHWNWTEGQEIPVFVYTDAPKAELFLNGRSLGVQCKEISPLASLGRNDKRSVISSEVEKSLTKGDRAENVESRYRLAWSVPFEKGELMSVSLNDKGKPVDTTYVRTAEKPAGIRLDYDGRRIQADGEDLAYVTVSIVDAEGNPCPLASDEVSFEVTGPGTFRACANGDPTNTEPFQGPSMHAFNGKLTAIVQSSAAKAGKIFLKASAPGLKAETLTIRSTFARPKEAAVVCGEIRKDRKDDLIWENEYSGYRAFGPALQARGDRLYGYDIFTKSVTRPVLHERYAKALGPQKLSFHLDHGDGMDSYGVGPTLGCGTAALVDASGSIVYPQCYQSAEILQNGPRRFQVRLTYPPVSVDGREVVEHRLITLDSGSRLNRVDIRYEGLDGPCPIAVGIVVHAENPKGFYADDKVLAVADLGDRNVGQNGEMYCGAVLPGGFERSGFEPMAKPEAGAIGHVLGHSTYVPGTTFTYYFGSGWSKAGIADLNEWIQLIKP